jgi:lysozyme family protein
MSLIDERINNLAQLSSGQLMSIVFDRHESRATRERAKDLVNAIDGARLRAAAQRFEEASATFAELTQGLLAVIEGSSSTARAGLTSIVRETGTVLAELVGDGNVDSAKTFADVADAAAEIDDAAGAARDIDAPLPGTATNSRQFSVIANEYRAMFRAAVIDPAKLDRIDRAATRLVGFRARYQSVGESLDIPWYFIGLVHSMESACNFGCHLHNGDRLTERTSRVPAGRPPAEVGDPPFTWEVSATDALKSHQLHVKSDWSLPAVLFRLEKYNGWGYRFKGLASPYLWSFSDRYTTGKYVADGQFDPAAKSDQCGAAVILKRLEQRGEVELQAG